MKLKLLFFLFLLCSTSLKAQVEVAIFSLNDFHAGFVRDDTKGVAGAPSVLQTLDFLKRVYPCNVTVSAGDNFGGSYFYNATHGILLPKFFSEMGIRLSAVGNHEFDDGQKSLSEKWRFSPLRPADWDITYVCANVRENATGRIPAFAQPIATQTVKLPSGKDFRICFTGLLTSSTPLQVSVRRIAGLSFDGNTPAVLDSVLALPEAEMIRNANLNILLTHIGSKMNAAGKPVWVDPDSARLSTLTRDTWQAVLSSHTHEAVCGYINASRLPIVQGQWHGDYISCLICKVDTATLQVTDIIPRIFRVTPKDNLEPIPAQLQAQIDSLLRNTRTAGGAPLGERLTTAKQTLHHDRKDKYKQTQLGTLVCEAYATAFRETAKLPDHTPIIGCSHFGSIRAGITKGAVSVMDIGETLPFSNALRTFQMTGAELLRLVDAGLHNQEYGWIQTSNLELSRDAAGNVRQLVYVSPNGYRKVLKAADKCYVVADEFMVNGGDGYAPALFPASSEVKSENMPATTDAFINYLRSKPSI